MGPIWEQDLIIDLPRHYFIPQGVVEFPLPSPYQPTNFTNSVGLRYEAMEVRVCLESSRKESEVMPLSHTHITMEIMEDILKQLGPINYR